MDIVLESPFILLDQLDHQPSTKEKVPVQCPKCKNIKSVTLASHLQTIRKNEGSYLCHKCSIDRKKCAENARKLWDNPEKARQMRDHLKSDEMKKAISEKNKRLFADEKWRKEWEAKIDREAISKASKKMWESKEYREKASKSFSKRCKKQWKDPDYRAKMEAYRSTPEYKERMDKLRHSEKFKEKMREVWADPVYREKMSDVRLESLKKMNGKPSKQQYILYSILDDLEIQYNMEYRMGPYHIDCRIPMQDGIKKGLLIEVQGDRWHSDALPKRISNDKSRSTYLMRYFSEYDFKYIWEHEFSNKGRVVSLVRYWLGLAEPGQVDFNITDVSSAIIDFKTAELFISKYHYAGRIGRSGLNIGFYLDDKLIAVCAFAYPVRKETASKQGLKYQQVFELTRLAIHSSYQKKNFASFIISKSVRFVQEQRPKIKRLVSFADSTYNHDGTIYKASNWILDGVVKPDYWYADGDGYVCHKKTLWNKASQMKMTEKEYRERYGYQRVYGGEKYRYIYSLDIA